MEKELDFEFYVYGVPKGQKTWGNLENKTKTYLQSFYDNSETDEIKFLVEIREENNTTYCYYSYLRCANIVDFDNRPGSYFGMTIRLDRYCSDVKGLYNLLNMIYEKKILSLVLDNNGQKTRYLISDFQSINTELESIRNEVIGMFQRYFSSPSDYKYDISSSKEAERQVYQLNLLDCIGKLVWDILQKYYRVAISPYYNTKKEQKLISNYDKEKAEITQNKDIEISNLNDKLSKEKDNVVQLQQKINKLNNENYKLQSFVKKMQAEIEKYQNALSSEIKTCWMSHLNDVINSLKKTYSQTDFNKEYQGKQVSETKSKMLQLYTKLIVLILNFILLLFIASSVK